MTGLTKCGLGLLGPNSASRVQGRPANGKPSEYDRELHKSVISARSVDGQVRSASELGSSQASSEEFCHSPLRPEHRRWWWQARNLCLLSQKKLLLSSHSAIRQSTASRQTSSMASLWFSPSRYFPRMEWDLLVPSWLNPVHRRLCISNLDGGVCRSWSAKCSPSMRCCGQSRQKVLLSSTVFTSSCLPFALRRAGKTGDTVMLVHPKS